MRVSIVCHGNIARSQILHHYLAEYSNSASLDLDLFSCGTAPLNAFPDVDVLLDEVQTELRRRGLHVAVKRTVLDTKAIERLVHSDLILVADTKRRNELLGKLKNRVPEQNVMLFYEFICEGDKDFVDTYNTNEGTQDPERFAACFDELERIAKLTVERIQRNPHTD